MARNNLKPLESRLFQQKWVKFPEGIRKIRDVDSPGVYVIALTRSDMLGKRVTEDAISYVGMSNFASLRKRLRRFKQGLKKGRGHAAANRLHGRRMKGKAFFVAGVGVPCNTKKSSRSPDDLRKIGIVAALEMYVLARIKQRTVREPSLNKK